MEHLGYIQRHLDQLYATPAELKRHVIVRLPVERRRNEKAWKDLFAASEEVSALWKGPDAVEEIKAQREKL